MKIDCTYTSLLPIWLMFMSFFTSAMCSDGRRDLSEIQYTFTPCGATGRLGPSFSDCSVHYAATNSPIFRDDVLFEFENGDFQGAQGFHIHKDGLYNITVVGAGGGRGICNNVLGGRGVLRTVQVNFTTEFELLIMVGQKGIEPCALIPTSDPVYEKICSSPPEYPENSTMCNSTWYNLTRDYDRGFYEVFGGAGGGGASMVRARNRTSGLFDDFPIVIAGGGSGTPAILDFDVVEKIDVTVERVLLFFGNLNAIAYSSYVNGRIREVDTGLLAGTRGSRNSSSTQTAGAGGGYSDRILGTSVIPTDGRSFRFPHDFAEGGVDCARIQALLQTGRSVPFRGSFGGFGGGGGACGGGGGGGGYTGGDVRGVGNTVPASGGFSYTGGLHSTSFNVTTTEDSVSSNRFDGFVTIVLENCGCAHECTVYEDDAQFECSCPNNTVLAPDMSDCFLELSPNPLTIRPINSHVFNTSLILLPSSTFLYGINASLSNDRTESDDCVLLFLGSQSQVVAVSNTVSMPGVANKLALVDNVSNTTSTLPLTYMDLLSSPVLVTGALLVGTAQCSLGTMTITFLVSIRDTPSAAIPIQDPSEISTATLAAALDVAQTLLTTPSEGTSVTPSNPSSEQIPIVLSSGGVIGIVFGIVVVLVLIILSLVIFVTMFRKKRRTKLSISNTRKQTAVNSEDAPFTIKYSDSTGIVTSTSGYNNFGLPNDILMESKCLKLGNVIGEGEFGIVYKAQFHSKTQKSAESQTVAVKTLKGFFTQQHIDDMIQESKKMFHLDHPNVQKLLGVCIDGGATPFIVMPFMKNGSLISYLRKNKEKLFIRKSESNDYQVDRVTTQLTDICYQIAKGMEYLASKRIIHRDLAARNCMINDNQTICVSDFGLSENLYTKTYFRQENHTSVPLPLKWTAPESINFGIFSEKTDVWSFGVTCWEVFSVGKMPYPGISALALPQHLEDGYRMDKPSNAACSDTVYNIMKQCWLTDATERPCFTDVVKEISTDLEATAGYLQLQLLHKEN